MEEAPLENSGLMVVNCGNGRSSCERATFAEASTPLFTYAVERIVHQIVQLRAQRHVLRIELVDVHAALRAVRQLQPARADVGHFQQHWPGSSRCTLKFHCIVQGVTVSCSGAWRFAPACVSSPCDAPGGGRKPCGYGLLSRL